MGRKKPLNLVEIEQDIRETFELVKKIINDPSSVKKPKKSLRNLLSSIVTYKSDALEGAKKAYKVFRINGYDKNLRPLADIVLNRVRAFASLPTEKLQSKRT